MKYILPTAMMLFSIAVLATGGGPQASREVEKQKGNMNSQREMERRSNNASVNIGTGGSTEYNGEGTTEKDIRPQGKTRNNDYSDTDLKSNDD